MEGEKIPESPELPASSNSSRRETIRNILSNGVMIKVSKLNDNHAQAMLNRVPFN
jgi:hypothetical protein